MMSGLSIVRKHLCQCPDSVYLLHVTLAGLSLKQQTNEKQSNCL